MLSFLKRVAYVVLLQLLFVFFIGILTYVFNLQLKSNQLWLIAFVHLALLILIHGYILFFFPSLIKIEYKALTYFIIILVLFSLGYWLSDKTANYYQAWRLSMLPLTFILRTSTELNLNELMNMGFILLYDSFISAAICFVYRRIRR